MKPKPKKNKVRRLEWKVYDALIDAGWREIKPGQWESPDSPKIYTRAEALEAYENGL